MADIGIRVLPPPPRMRGRSYNDVSQEIQEYLEAVGEFTDSVNTYLETVIGAGGPDGTPTVSAAGGSGRANIFQHMGA